MVRRAGSHLLRLFTTVACMSEVAEQTTLTLARSLQYYFTLLPLML